MANDHCSSVRLPATVPQVEQSGGPEQGAQYQVVAPQEGLKQLREHWDGLLLLPRTEEALEGAALP